MKETNNVNIRSNTYGKIFIDYCLKKMSVLIINQYLLVRGFYLKINARIRIYEGDVIVKFNPEYNYYE